MWMSDVLSFDDIVFLTRLRLDISISLGGHIAAAFETAQL